MVITAALVNVVVAAAAGPALTTTRPALAVSDPTTTRHSLRRRLPITDVSFRCSAETYRHHQRLRLTLKLYVAGVGSV